MRRSIPGCGWWLGALLCLAFSRPADLYERTYARAAALVADAAARTDYVRTATLLEALPEASEHFRATVALAATERVWPPSARRGVQEGRYLLLTGWLLESVGRADSALQHFNRAGLLFDRYGRNDLMAWAHYGQEYLLSNVDGYAERGIYFDRIIATAEAEGMTDLLAMAYSLKSYQASYAGDLATADAYAARALAQQQRRGDWPEVLREYLNLASLARQGGREGEARAYLQRAQTLYEERNLNRPALIARVFLELTQYEVEAGRYPSAERYLGRAHDSLTVRAGLKDWIDWTAFRILLYEYQGQYDTAFYYLYEKQYYEDSLRTLESHGAATEQMALYRTRDAEADRARAELESRRLTSQRNYSLLLLTLFGGLIAALVFLVRQRRKTARLELEALRRENNLRVTQSLLDGQEAERRRIAQDLHDGLGGHLAGLRWTYTELADDLDRRGVDHAALPSIDAGLRTAYERVRDLSHELNHSDLKQYGLVRSLEQYAERLGRGGKLRVRVRNQGTALRLPEPVEVQLFLVIVELCTNTLKHAAARRLDIELTWLPDELSIMVVDDGVGFDPAAAVSGMGLRGVAQRVAQIGGHLLIDSGRGAGTTVVLDVPLPQPNGLLVNQ